MKYIKTKDGIYEVTEDLTINKFGHLARKNDPIITIPNVGEIINQADTIEELCDYAVYYDFEKELVIRKLPLSSSWKSLYRDTKLGLISDVKLAILTEKGLIYVAKMNEKGEFELL